MRRYVQDLGLDFLYSWIQCSKKLHRVEMTQNMCSPPWFHRELLMAVARYCVITSSCNQCKQYFPAPVCLDTHIVRPHAGDNFRDYNTLPLSLQWVIKRIIQHCKAHKSIITPMICRKIDWSGCTAIQCNSLKVIRSSNGPSVKMWLLMCDQRQHQNIANVFIDSQCI